jgi:tetratricopeptide repeat protein 30
VGLWGIYASENSFLESSYIIHSQTNSTPRSEDELDAVTLHNQALMNMDSKPTEGFEKLQFLLQQNPFPPETFGNLLLLYCKYEYYDLAADVLAENAHLTYKYLSPHLYDFLEALITQQTSPDEAYRKFDAIASKHTEQLRKYTKQVKVKTFLKPFVLPILWFF